MVVSDAPASQTIMISILLKMIEVLPLRILEGPYTLESATSTWRKQ